VSELFANLYLDEDVSPLVAKLIRSRGLVAISSQEANRNGMSDLQQLLFAAERRMAILSHNRADFEKLAADFLRDNRHHSGIIISVRRTPHQIAGRLLELLNHVSADEMDDQVYYI